MNPSTKFKQILASLVFALGLISPPVFSESFTGGLPASPQPDSADEVVVPPESFAFNM